MSDVAPTLEEAAKFIFHEARLLDQQKFPEWLSLFTKDTTYWIPRERGQSDPKLVPSIIYENHALLQIRVQRLQHPRIYSAAPMPRTLHVVGNVEIDRSASGGPELVVRSNQIVVESAPSGQRVFAGEYQHVLRRTDNGYQIAAKRIDLISCDAIHQVMVVLL